MKTKKLLMPLALLFGALLLTIGKAKAQTTIPVYLYTYSDNEDWVITYHNNTTNVDYNFSTEDGWSHSRIENYGYVILGSVPPGDYTVTLTNSAQDPWTYEDIYINGVENDHSLTNPVNGNGYTFGTTVTISSTDAECDIVGQLDSDE